MLIISYDISDTKLRSAFSKMIRKNGAIRLQYSVYEINNTSRMLDNIIIKIESYFSERFSMDDSVIIFNVDANTIIKYGNSIHLDVNVVYL